MNKPIIAPALLILVCWHLPAEAAIPTPRTTQRSLSGLTIVLPVRSVDHSLSARLIQPDFYQVIIDNNLFRPLGWTKPKSNPVFELIATVIKQNDKRKALIRNTKTRKVRYVAVGAELSAGVAVEKIDSQSVTLKENGESKVYRLPL